MIYKLIYKYLNNDATEDEVASVFDWIESSEKNKTEFIALKKAWIISTHLPTQKDIDWKNFKAKNKKNKSSILWKCAAILVIGLTITATIFITRNPNTLPLNTVVLELDNGTKNYIEGQEEKQYLSSKGDIVAKQKASEIIYLPKQDVTNKEIVYNTLKIPNGKTFKVTLSDGTLVYLNAGTTLKFPEQFNDIGQRTVFLDGEAFFEVSKDENRPFTVNVNQVAIEVLGTKFNISAYNGESTHCELAEGLVKISEQENKNNSVYLYPNNQARWNESSKTFDTKQVDVSIYTSWIYGELIFKETPFHTISKKLERSFNVQILNSNSHLANQNFTGTIKINESNVESILDLFKIDTPFEYSKSSNIITINKP